MDVQNVNPTILAASQLPTRQPRKQRRSVNEEEYKFHDIVTGRPHGYRTLSWSDDSDDTESDDGFTFEPIDEQEIYDLISPISDPEHPISLGQLAVVNLPDIHIDPAPSAMTDPNTMTTVLVKITPTIAHCSLATVIGLGIRVRLEQALPPNYRVDVIVSPGSHAQADQVTKQLADKERVAAALENDTLKGVIDNMLKTCE